MVLGSEGSGERKRVGEEKPVGDLLVTLLKGKGVQIPEGVEKLFARDLSSDALCNILDGLMEDDKSKNFDLVQRGNIVAALTGTLMGNNSLSTVFLNWMRTYDQQNWESNRGQNGLLWNDFAELREQLRYKPN